MISGGVIVGGAAAALVYLIGRGPARDCDDPLKVKRRNQILMGIAAGLSVGVVQVSNATGFSSWVEVLLGLKSRVTVIFEQELEPLMGRDDFEQWKRASGESDLETRTARAAANGFHFFDLSDTQELIRLQSVLSERSPEFCAGLWLGTNDDFGIERTAELLGEEDTRVLARLTVKSIGLSIERGDAPPRDEELLGQAMAAVMKRVPVEERDLLARSAQDWTGVSPDEACRLVRLLMREAPGLPSDQQLALLRIFIQG